MNIWSFHVFSQQAAVNDQPGQWWRNVFHCDVGTPADVASIDRIAVGCINIVRNVLDGTCFVSGCYCTEFNGEYGPGIPANSRYIGYSDTWCLRSATGSLGYLPWGWQTQVRKYTTFGRSGVTFFPFCATRVDCHEKPPGTFKLNTWFEQCPFVDFRMDRYRAARDNAQIVEFVPHQRKDQPFSYTFSPVTSINAVGVSHFMWKEKTELRASTQGKIQRPITKYAMKALGDASSLYEYKTRWAPGYGHWNACTDILYWLNQATNPVASIKNFFNPTSPMLTYDTVGHQSLRDPFIQQVRAAADVLPFELNELKIFMSQKQQLAAQGQVVQGDWPNFRTRAEIVFKLIHIIAFSRHTAQGPFCITNEAA